MKVKELREALEPMDGDADVLIRDSDTGWVMPLHKALEDGCLLLYGYVTEAEPTIAELRASGVL